MLGHRKTLAVDEDMRTLSFPGVFNHPKNSKYDAFTRQTYADFAAMAERRNPNYTFAKETMDKTFGLACRQVGRKVSTTSKLGSEDFEKMMARVI